MIRPGRLAASIAAPKMRVGRTTLVRLRSIDWRHVDNGSSWMAPLVTRLPTLFTRMSIGPSASRISSHACSQASGMPMSTTRVQAWRPRARISFGGAFQGVRCPAGDHHVGAGVGQCERHFAAKAAAGAGHESASSIKAEEVECIHGDSCLPDVPPGRKAALGRHLQAGGADASRRSAAPLRDLPHVMARVAPVEASPLAQGEAAEDGVIGHRDA